MNKRKFNIFNKDGELMAKGVDINTLVAIIIGYSSSSIEKINFSITEDVTEEVN